MRHWVGKVIFDITSSGTFMRCWLKKVIIDATSSGMRVWVRKGGVTMEITSFRVEGS